MVSAKLADYSELIEQASKTIPFDSEDYLIEIVIKQIHQFLDGNVVVSTELPVGAGVVDIVAGQIKDCSRKEFCYQTLTRTQAYILSHLYYKRRLKLTTIARRTELPIEFVKNTLITLCQGGYCIASGQCYVRTSLVTSLIAIEGKIRDWKRALQQAIRNQLFSSQSFVAIDAKYSQPALKNILLFKKHHIGLAIVFRSGSIQVVYSPPNSHPLASVMPIIAETALLERTSLLEC